MIHPIINVALWIWGFRRRVVFENRFVSFGATVAENRAFNKRPVHTFKISEFFKRKKVLIVTVLKRLCIAKRTHTHTRVTKCTFAGIRFNSDSCLKVL